MNAPLLTVSASGLYCPAGDFYIDPGEGVERAVLTHAHGDHARSGSGRYFASSPSLAILKRRLGESAPIESLGYGESLQLGAARISLHPAGHILGSAQIRIEAEGQVWVVSGDYKRDPDPTCAAFEPLACDVFITEATFALPIYRWDPIEKTMAEILRWWDGNVRGKRASVLFCYSLGKAQRLLAELSRIGDRRIYVHGAVESMVQAYREAGVKMAATERVGESRRGRSFAGELILAPPSAFGSRWIKRLSPASTAFASGWMRLRGTRRRRGFDRGFAVSDHADWPSLLRTVEESGARQVLVTHGYGDALVRYLQESGRESALLKTHYADEES